MMRPRIHRSRSGGWIIFILNLMLQTLLLSGCRTSERKSTPAFRIPEVSNVWQSPNLYFAAVTVKEFGWRYARLQGWENSADAIRTAFHGWLGVPESKSVHLREPDRQALHRFLTETLPQAAGSEDIVFLYLGTHQLRDGRILLAGGDSISANELSGWLSRSPGRIILFADVCYAGAIESRTEFADSIVRIHGGDSDRRLPDINFSYTQLAVNQFFQPLRQQLEKDFGIRQHRFSLAGLLWLQAMRTAVTNISDNRIPVHDLFQRFVRQAQALDTKAKTYSPPLPEAVNMQSWPLAERR